jgi:hypothetical protein
VGGNEKNVELLGLTQGDPGVEKMISRRPLNAIFPLALAAALLLPGCEQSAEPAPVGEPAAVEAAPSEAATKERSAEELLQQHCTRCHLIAEPTDLSREYWSYALHYMGNYVGMPDDVFDDMRVEPVPPEWEPVQDYTRRYLLFDSIGYMRDLYPFKPYIPEKPEMTKEEYNRIRDYYLANAKPWQEMEIKRPKQPLAPGFQPMIPNLELEPNGLIIATHVDEARGRIYVGWSVVDDWVGGGGRKPGFEDRDQLMVFDLATGKRTHQVELVSDAIHMTQTSTGVRVLTHGRFPMSPVGLAALTDWEFDGAEPRARMLVNGKHRFVEHHDVDMDGDGLEDIVANAFGDGIFGDANAELTIFWRTALFGAIYADASAEIPPGVLAGALEETIVSNQSGLIGSAIADMNKDGLPDIVALTAQARQELMVFINQGDRTFSRLLIEENTPPFGGNSVEVGDFNGDGNTDILVMNGDNVAGNHVGNVVPAPRPHHSVRVFRNHGNLEFTKEFHYPMHGATRAVVHDFDADGDLDIAAVAFFPQWNAEEPETFVYLENRGGFEFQPYSFAKEYFGNWVSIEAADVNADSKTDIVLGLSNYPELVPANWLTEHPAMQGRDGKAPSVMYLINTH